MVDEIPRELQLSRQATFAATRIGSLLKDSRGAFHLSLTKKLIHSPSSEHAEACAMLESLKIAACFGHSRVVFESDCKTLVDVISSLGYALCTLDHIYSRIRLFFVRCSGNAPAHLLAFQITSNYPSTFEWK
ncbi:hypothetical protein M9H77_35210 [Catharanthus roseus]|uniref:Uncharacterized protein n=1 Tax=Catharanthus roseus TaxID=4058 RepID=A0ACB9ZNL8_CATRO|nr:hypothetical protein M9H77_35210 [Catharanthus roseus]